MSIEAHFLPESLLEFGSRQNLEHPQDGLFLYGPVEAPGRPGVIHVGVIGTRDGIDLVAKWLRKLMGRLPVESPDKLHTSPWPGFQAAFGVRLETMPLVTLSLVATEIERAIRKNNRYDAVRSAVKLFEEAIVEHMRSDERRPDVWIVVVPEIVFRYGRPQVSGPSEATRSELMSAKTAAGFLRGGSLFSEMTEEAETYLFTRNFHHQLKAQLLHKRS